MIRISIAMATYNGERFIAQQMKSLAGQTHLPAELVVCDDGSTDATLAIVEDFARTAPFPVRIFRNETNLGYVRNFLKAASLCEGDWIAFCDQDDVWVPEKLAMVAGAAEKQRDAVLVVHPAAVVDEALTPTGATIPRLPRASLLPRLGQPPWFKVHGFCCTFDARLIRLIPQDRLPSNLFAPGKTQTADKRIVWLANVLGSTVVLHRPLARYRRHGGNVSALQTGERTRSEAPAEHDRLRADVMAEYVEELRGYAQAGQAEPFRGRLLEAADYYGRLSRWHRLRLELFGGSPVRRLSSFSRLMAERAYGGRGGRGLGLRAMVRDVALVLGAG